MTTDTDLAELAQALAKPDWCLACLGNGPLRPWPLANEWGDVGEPVCVRCWLARVRGGDVVVRYTGRVLEVWTTHPQRGELLRGTIRAVGIEAHKLQPAIRWQLTGPEQADLGELSRDYVEAEARLLAATSWADEISPSAPGGDPGESSAGTA